jgi:hypothetical protein
VDAAGRRVVDVDVEEGDAGADVAEEDAVDDRGVRAERESTESDFQRSRQARESAEVRMASRRSRRTRISSCRTTGGREESRSSAAAAACFGSIMPPVPDSPRGSDSWQRRPPRPATAPPFSTRAPSLRASSPPTVWPANGPFLCARKYKQLEARDRPMLPCTITPALYSCTGFGLLLPNNLSALLNPRTRIPKSTSILV